MTLNFNFKHLKQKCFSKFFAFIRIKIKLDRFHSLCLSLYQEETDRYAGYLGDWLHLFHTADRDLGYPEGAGDVCPLLARPCALHGSTLRSHKIFCFNSNSHILQGL
jgi:hypothetical protein